MPRGDGTGPGGMGPLTGRAAGYCAGYAMPGYANPYGGRFAAGVGYGYPARGYPARGYPAGQTAWAYGAFPYAWGGYPAYGGMARPRARGFGTGLGRGRGRRRW